MEGQGGMWSFVAVVLVLVNVVAANESHFTKSPKDVKVVLGQPIILPCEVTPSNGINYYWELNGSKITNTTRRFQNGGDLHITRVDRERDAGQFVCVAMGVAGQKLKSSSATIDVQFLEEPEVQLQEPGEVGAIARGGEVVLRCHLEGSGEIHVEWFRNSERVTKSPRIEIKKRKLHIKNVDSIDNGIYKCTAKNEAGFKKSMKHFALIVPNDKSPLLQVVPSNQVAKLGGVAYFECAYQRADVLDWYFGEKVLKNSEKYTLHSNGSLQINNVSEEDEGNYSCVGIRSESADVPQTYTAELQIAFIEQFTSTSFEPTLEDDKTKIVAENDTFQLTCLEPKGLPYPKKWWQNSKGHTISDTGNIRVDDGRLIIDNIQLENAEIYKCVAENIAGMTEKSVQIIVTKKPEIVLHPNSITVNEDDQAVLTCNYKSEFEQHTIVKWRKDGKPLKHEFDETSSSHHQRIKIFKHNGTLVIQSTQASDRGDYVCEVLTTAHEPVFSEPATISVIEELKFTPAPVNKKLELGSITKIHCKAQGTPTPTVKWEKDGMSSESFPSHVSDINGTLHFNGVVASDKGRYSCIASNTQGVINTSINIDVVVSPKFSILPKNPTEVTEGKPAMIDCVVEGDPKPTIQWDKNLKMNDFDMSRFTVLPNGSLFISEVRKDDENKYGCTAGSSAGLNRKDAQLIVHSQDESRMDQEGDSTVTKAVLITMSVAGAYIVLVIGLMVWCRYRRKSRKLPSGDTKAENGEIEHTELKDGVNGSASASKPLTNGIENHKEGQKSDGAETCNSQASNQSKKSKNNYENLALSRSLLKETKLIGRGEFGDVMIAKIAHSAVFKEEKRASQISKSSNNDKEEKEEKHVTVSVKVLSQTKEEYCLAEFKRELDMFTKLSHENVTKLHGLCREEEPHYMILEHTDWGDLKKFLTATKTGTLPALTPIQSLAVIHQISRAMDHISNNRLVHKDLAARNCLITSSMVIKVGLTRLTRDPYSQEYCKHMNQIIPLRWLPYEAVYEDEYSTKSDVYSLGVVMWEIFSQGELPHSKINDKSFLAKLKEKNLEWQAHPATPEAIQKIQESCWNINPQERPSFSQISKEIGEIVKSM